MSEEEWLQKNKPELYALISKRERERMKEKNFGLFLFVLYLTSCFFAIWAKLSSY